MTARLLLILCVSLLVGMAPARAQSLAAHGEVTHAIDADLRSGHAWFIDPCGPGNDTLLVHLPPRDESIGPPIARPMLALNSTPLALAARDAQVVMVLPREPDDAPPRGSKAAPSEPIRRVATVSTSRSGPVAWGYTPAGRAALLAPLPAAGTLRSLVITEFGPAVLISPEPDRRDGAPSATEWTLLVLIDGQWRSSTLPLPIRGSAWLIADGPRVLLIDAPAVDGPATIWSAQFVTPPADEPKPANKAPAAAIDEDDEDAVPMAARPVPTLTWNAPPFGVIARAPGSAAWTSLKMDWADGHLLAWSMDAGTVRLFRLEGETFTPLGQMRDIPATAAITPIAGLMRLTAAWSPQPREAPPNPDQVGPRSTVARTYVLRELSAVDGTQVLSINARKEGLLNSRDLGALALVLGTIMAAALLFVMRRESGSPIILPPGTALAPPGRRCLAGGLDMLIGIGLGCAVTGLSPRLLLWSSAMASPSEALTLLIASLASGAVIGTITESFIARSPGKMVFGIMVLGLRRIKPPTKGTPSGDQTDLSTAGEGESPDPVYIQGDLRVGYPAIWQAATRNLVKWFFPPLNLLMLMDGGLRHPADLISRTFVAEPIDED